MIHALMFWAVSAAFAGEPVIATSTPAASVAAPIPAAPPALTAPEPPQRDGKPLDSMQAVGLDLIKTLGFLEQARAFYTAFTSGGSHTAAENKAFLKLMGDYERELGHAKQELAALNGWLTKNADLGSKGP